ncbi:MAG: 3-dehydroquinate synthase [Patescibacteria group bacterium]
MLISDNNSFLDAERESMASYLRDSGLVVSCASFLFGEKNKNPKTLVSLVHDILQDKISKKSCIILLGGGITGNVGGFAASILYRGIRFVHVPTTLMHMVDSSTGGKQATNTKYGKNTIGSFFEPEFIFIDHRYIQTLPERQIRNGLAECIKHALCQDTEFFTFILNNSKALLKKEVTSHSRLVEKTIKLKLTTLDKDSYELNDGMVLVYGHTIGNAVESASRYTLTHGEAVSIGMVAAAKISEALGIADDDLVARHIAILEKIGLPTRIPKELSRKVILKFLEYDKKYVDKPMTFMLLTDVGKIYMKNGLVPKQVEPDVVKAVIDSLY